MVLLWVFVFRRIRILGDFICAANVENTVIIKIMLNRIQGLREYYKTSPTLLYRSHEWVVWFLVYICHKC